MPLFTMNEHNVIIAVSNGWLELLGYARDQVVGHPIREFWAPDTHAPPEPWQLVVPADARIKDIERRYAHRDGTVVDVLVSARRDGATVIAGVADISARRRAEAALKASEEHLRQAQKMQALGQLAAGIAHDFNNILQIVSGAAQLIERRPEDPAKVRHLAHALVSATARGASITQRLLSFARRGDLRAEAIAIAEFLDGAREVLTHTLGSGITVLTEFPPGTLALSADRGQLHTAIINIGANARDAMPSGGTLTLCATAEHVGEGRHPANLAAGGLAPGDYVRLSMTDNGAGMDAATLARASEPFFTTKPPGRGTGLGLAMVRGFAEQSGGTFLITSTPGAGTTVVLWLRQAVVEEASAGSEAHVAPLALVPRARILLVDDDDLVRETLAAQLEDQGFATLVAASGLQALALIETGEPVDAMVSDFSMPGMNGVVTIEKVRALRPLLPCFLLTGYMGERAALSAENTFTLVRKPVSGEALAAQIKAGLVKAGSVKA